MKIQTKTIFQIVLLLFGFNLVNAQNIQFANITECTSYTLPNLSLDSSYYTEPNKAGTQLFANDEITTTQTIYVHTESVSGTSIVTSETNFNVSIIGNNSINSINGTRPFCPGDNVNFEISGTPNADLTYNLGGSNITENLGSSGNKTVTITGSANPTETINLVSISSNSLPILGNAISAVGGRRAENTLGTPLPAGSNLDNRNSGELLSNLLPITLTLGNIVPAGTDITVYLARTNDVTVVKISDGVTSIEYTPAEVVKNVSEAVVFTTASDTDTITVSRIAGTSLINGLEYTIPGTTCTTLLTDTVTINTTPIISELTNNSAQYSSTTSTDIKDLNTLLATGITGGTWSETTISSPANSAFNAANGELDLNGLAIGVYTFDYALTNGNCSKIATITITINNTPKLDPITDVTICNAYELPNITGTNLSGNEAYYTGAGGTGTSYTAGTVLNYDSTVTYPLTLYVYDETGTIPNSSDEKSFLVTINPQPGIDAISDVTTCDNYELPIITGYNITSNAAYYTETGGVRTNYEVGDVINYSDFSSYPITLYAYDETDTLPNCIDQESFVLTINPIPDLDVIADATFCERYELPIITGTNLSGNEAYFTESGGAGTKFAAGYQLKDTDFTSYPVNLYVYDKTTGITNCSDEEIFKLFIDNNCTLSIDNNDLKNTLVYPNPINSVLNIELKDLSKSTEIQLYDVKGKVVLEKYIDSRNERIITEKLPKGIYFLRINNNSKSVVKKIIKK